MTIDRSTVDRNLGRPTPSSKILMSAKGPALGLSTGTDPILRMGLKGCIEKAVDKAVKGVNAPMLTQLRFGRTDVRLASK